MNRYRISRRATIDELDIWLHVAGQSADAADRLIDAFQKNYQTLADFPGLGQTCEQLGCGLRCFPVGNYVVYYRPIQSGIEVVRVIHGARDVRDLSSP